MMRERELKQVKSQLKTQTTKSQQQANNWRRKIEEKEEQMRELLIQKDNEMQGIVSQLLLFEAELRQEQSRIERLLKEKDAQINSQQKELERLKCVIDSQISNFPKCNNGIRKSGSISSCEDSDKDIYKTTSLQRRSFSVEEPVTTDSQHAVQKLKDGLLKIRGIQDVTNVKKSIDLAYDSVITDKKRIPYRAPQKMKDLKAKRMNSHNKIHRPVISELCTQAIL
nr:uncharacterized protein LOC107449016 isoform X2 [Parasteatoda tepidariorum]